MIGLPLSFVINRNSSHPAEARVNVERKWFEEWQTHSNLLSWFAPHPLLPCSLWTYKSNSCLPCPLVSDGFWPQEDGPRERGEEGRWGRGIFLPVSLPVWLPKAGLSFIKWSLTQSRSASQCHPLLPARTTITSPHPFGPSGENSSGVCPSSLGLPLPKFEGIISLLLGPWLIQLVYLYSPSIHIPPGISPEWA